MFGVLHKFSDIITGYFISHHFHKSYLIMSKEQSAKCEKSSGWVAEYTLLLHLSSHSHVLQRFGVIKSYSVI